MHQWDTRNGVDYLTVGGREFTVRPAKHPKTGAHCYVAQINGRQVGGTYAIRYMARAVLLRTAGNLEPAASQRPDGS